MEFGQSGRNDNQKEFDNSGRNGDVEQGTLKQPESEP